MRSPGLRPQPRLPHAHALQLRLSLAEAPAPGGGNGQVVAEVVGAAGAVRGGDCLKSCACMD